VPKRYLSLVAVFLLVTLAAWYYLFPPDVVTLANESGSDVPVVLVDGQRWLCADDEVRRGTAVGIGNLVPSSTCMSEVAVFAQDNAMNLVTPVTSWTTSGGDALSITQAARLQVPLTVWTLSGLPADATVHATRADQIYNLMQAGLKFSPPDIRDYHSQTRITEASCETLATLKAAFAPVEKRINVYYVPTVKAPVTSGSTTTIIEVDGRWCDADPNIVLIGSFQPETLAHELGHALSLAHIGGTGLPATNLMNGAAVPRDSLTTGQSFRVNVNDNSSVNVNGVRSGPIRKCPDSQTDNRCPSLTLDVVPK
jgi:hypothetical protein